ncbi:MAG: hypothetical protein QME90_02610 [Thermodesulfobacteriota bacterium]|nr:hypothetical protein [Thermodesulfobacteriota bacterium]
MRKRISCYLPLLLIILLGLILISLYTSEGIFSERMEGKINGIAFAQNMEGEGKKGEQDTHFIQLMRQLRTKVDGWLKDLNQRIESEDVTRFEVRFLEILRSILEWVREKIDAQIGTNEERKPEGKITGKEV